MAANAVAQYLDDDGNEIKADPSVKLPQGYALLSTNKSPVAPKVTASVKELKKVAATKKPISPPSGYVLQAPVDLTSNPKNEGLYSMYGRTGQGDALGEFKVPYSRVQEALGGGATFTSGSQDVYAKDKAAEGKPVSWYQQILQSPKLAPTPNESPRATFGNEEKAVARTVLATPAYAKQLLDAAQSMHQGNVSGGDELANLLNPFQMPTQLLDQFKIDAKSDPKMAVDNLIGSAVGLGVVGVATHGAEKLATRALSSHPFTPVESEDIPARERTNIIHNSPSGQVRQKPGEAPSVWLEPDAWKAYMEAVHPGEDHASVNGVVLAQREDLPQILSDPNASNSPHWPEVQKIISAAREAAGDEGIAVGVKRGRGVKHAVNIMREELNHTAQRKIAGSLRGLVSEDTYGTLHKAIPQGMLKYLEGEGYDLHEPVTTVSEATAKLMGGKAEDFGVTPEEKKAYLKSYFTEIANHHGKESLDLFRHLVDNSNSIKEQVYAEHAGKENPTGANEGLADNRPDGSSLQSVSGGWRGGSEQVYRPAGVQTGSGTEEVNGVQPRGEQVAPAADPLFNREKDRPVWYLKSEKIIGEKMRGPMPGQDVSKMLIAGGVKPEEMHWTGLDDFLKTKGKDKVTPQEIKDHLAENNIKIKEVTKGDYTSLDALDKKIRSLSHWPDDANKARNPADQAQLDELNKEWERENTKADSPTKYQNYQLPGGKNYREMLLTMPSKALPAPKIEFSKVSEFKGEPVYEAKLADGGKVTIHHNPGFPWRIEYPKGESDGGFSTAEEAIESVQKNQRYNPIPKSPDFQSNHWEEPNILAHVRFNDRTGPSGEKLLHVEEAQSDWGQRGRKDGFADPKIQKDLKEKVDAAKKSHDEILKKLEASKNDLLAENLSEGYDEEKLESLKAKVRSEMAQRTLAHDKLRDANLNLDYYNRHNVPEMPNSKTWHEMTLRRMVKHAVENGYDGVSWTGGADQADRYSLAKQVNSIQYTDDGKLIAYGKDGDYKDFGIVPEEKLGDYIGKEAARKLLDQPKAEKHGEKGVYPGDRVLSGVDLKVGGEGMKGFYDKIVPDYLNKFGKKYGSKVGETTIAADKYGDTAHRRFALRNPNGEIASQFPTRQEAEKAAKSRQENGHGNWPVGATWKVEDSYPENDKKVQYLPITSEMRKSVGEEGVPLFNREQVKTPEFKKFFGDSKIVDEQGEPKVVYHGGTSDFNTFAPAARGSKTGNPNAQLGYFFTDSPNEASRYAETFGKKGGNVAPVYLAIRNPYKMPFKELDDMAMATYRSMMAEPGYDPNKRVKFGDMEAQKEAAQRTEKHQKIAEEAARKRRDELIAAGYDGVLAKVGGVHEYIAFHPEQIKSAIGNSGAFDPSDPNILRNREKSPDADKDSDNIYYHVVGKGWSNGDDIVSFNEMQRRGTTPKWKWDAADSDHSSHLVSLHESLKDAADFRREFGGKILKVKIPEGEEEPHKNIEGYPTLHSVPASWASEVDKKEVKRLDDEHREVMVRDSANREAAYKQSYENFLKGKTPEELESLPKSQEEYESRTSKIWDQQRIIAAPILKIPYTERTPEQADKLEESELERDRLIRELGPKPPTGILRNRETPSAAGLKVSEINSLGGAGQSQSTEDRGSTGTTPNTVLPIHGGTVLVSAPIQNIPVVRTPSSANHTTERNVSVPLETALGNHSVQTKRVLPLSQVKILAAGLMPQRQPKSVREVMEEARQRFGNQIVP